MNDSDRLRLPRGNVNCFGAFLLLAVVANCAGPAGSQRGAAASFSGGKFAPSNPPAAQYGADPARTCASSSIIDRVQRDVAGLASQVQKQPPATDGRLCAMAEALLAWDDKQPVPEELNAFLGPYFGVPQIVSRVIVTTAETDKEEEIVPVIDDAIGKFLPSATRLRYGLAISKQRRGPIDRTAIAQGRSAPSATKLALVMQDSTLELDLLPRKLDPSAEAIVKGRLVGDLQNATVLVSDTRGKLQQPPGQKTKEFSAPISCEGGNGRMVVEIRGEEQGSPRVLAGFPVFCGTNP